MITHDTICAISTPAGVGGIAVARISGPDALSIVDRIWHGTPISTATSHTAHLGWIVDPESGERLDQGVATVFRGPASFTGEDVVELGVHGSRWIQRELISLLIRQGCRLAEAGEFTRRAFSSGRMDLAEAEGVADVIAASSRAAHRIAVTQMRGEFSRKLRQLHDTLLDLASLLELELDFSEEDVEFASREKLRQLAAEIDTEVNRLAESFAAGRAIKDGVPVAIVGATNAGKSTLLNRLLRDDKAIVSDIHGTTRDVVEDAVELGGTLFRFIDTAGLRDTTDTVEQMGIKRAINRMEGASIVLLVIDPTETTDTHSLSSAWQRIAPHIGSEQKLIVLINKADTLSPERQTEFGKLITSAITLPPHTTILPISAKTGQGTDRLEQHLTDLAGLNSTTADSIMVTNHRHYQALVSAAQSIARVREGLDTDLPGDLIAQDIRETLHHLGTITGTITTADILTTIFSRFCIGK